MRNEKPTWFWVLTASFILAWSVAGTLSIIFILNGSVYMGEAVIIIATVILVIIYYVTDWLISRK